MAFLASMVLRSANLPANSLILVSTRSTALVFSIGASNHLTQYYVGPAGNTSTDLVYMQHEKQELGPGVVLTTIKLKDSYYPFFVELCVSVATFCDNKRCMQ